MWCGVCILYQQEVSGILPWIRMVLDFCQVTSSITESDQYLQNNNIHFGMGLLSSMCSPKKHITKTFLRIAKLTVWKSLMFLNPPVMQGSLLATTSKTSSTCTGAYTSEMGLAVIQKTINDSGVLHFGVAFQPLIAYDKSLVSQCPSRCIVDLAS